MALQVVSCGSFSSETDTGGGLSPTKSPTGKSFRILLVEDDVSNQFATTTLLKLYGYHVDVASNGKEALDLLKEDEFALVLMDCSMPVMDGYTATAIIRDQSSKVKNHTIPVIGLTGNVMREECDRCLAVGMNEYMSKPIIIPDLISKLEKWKSIESTVTNCGSRAAS